MRGFMGLRENSETCGQTKEALDAIQQELTL